MRSAVRFAIELLLLGLLAGALFVAVIVVVQRLIDDEKVQYLVIGYYAATHSDLARWIWKRLRIKKEAE